MTTGNDAEREETTSGEAAQSGATPQENQAPERETQAQKADRVARLIMHYRTFASILGKKGHSILVYDPATGV